MGRTQVMAVAVLGMWLGGTLFVWFAASGSFSTVDRVLRSSDPHFAEATEPLAQDQTRTVLRYLASEINRTTFRAYGWAQLVLGALLLFLLLRQTPRDATALAFVGTMFGLVLVLTLLITPQLVTLGRALDFIPRNPPPPEMARFRMLHGAFTGLDGIKWVAGLAVLVRWIVAR